MSRSCELQRRLVGVSVLRGVLRVAEVPYTLAVRLRKHRYNVERMSVDRYECAGRGGWVTSPWAAREKNAIRIADRGAERDLLTRSDGAEIDEAIADCAGIDRVLIAAHDVGTALRIAQPPRLLGVARLTVHR